MQAIRKSKPRERLLFTLLTETELWMRDSPANVGACLLWLFTALYYLIVIYDKNL